MANQNADKILWKNEIVVRESKLEEYIYRSIKIVSYELPKLVFRSNQCKRVFSKKPCNTFKIFYDFFWVYFLRNASFCQEVSSDEVIKRRTNCPIYLEICDIWSANYPPSGFLCFCWPHCTTLMTMNLRSFPDCLTYP